MKTYRDLLAWQKAIDLVIASYDVAKLLPRDEVFGLVSQIRRAAGSVPANIAEGYGRTTRPDYLRHLSIASGSLAELETHLIVAHRLRYISVDQLEPAWNLTQEVGMLLRRLKASLGEPRES